MYTLSPSELNVGVYVTMQLRLNPVLWIRIGFNSDQNPFPVKKILTQGVYDRP